MKYLKPICLYLLIFLFLNCSPQKRTYNELSNIINDYISEFSLLKFEKPKAIFICKNNQGQIQITDIPRNATTYFLNEGKYSVKKYSNVLCFYDSQKFNLNSNYFRVIPTRLKRKAMNKKKTEIKIFNTEIEISNEAIEWNSSLEIIYHLNENNNIFQQK